MKLDLHTLRYASGDDVVKWALKQKNWAIINPGNISEKILIEVEKGLISLGITVDRVNILGQENLSAAQSNDYTSISEVENDLDIVCILGDIDLWDLIQDITKRMQWYGDLKCIWLTDELNDERWNSEIYDYGLAVISSPMIIDRV